MPSSVIRALRYNAHAETLDVTFVTGRIYRYFAVPDRVAQAFETAQSKGIFFNAEIRDRYAFEERQ